MSEIAQKLFAGLSSVKEAVQEALPGLKDLVPEATAELSRLKTQGAMELASALFGNSAFVPYGPGQYTPDVQPQAEQQPQQERGDMER